MVMVGIPSEIDIVSLLFIDVIYLNRGHDQETSYVLSYVSSYVLLIP
jgi:hypothetical protein